MEWKSRQKRGSHRANGETMAPKKRSEMQVALLAGGSGRHYTYGLAMSLAAAGVGFDVVGGDGVDGPEMHETRA